MHDHVHVPDEAPRDGQWERAQKLVETLGEIHFLRDHLAQLEKKAALLSEELDS